MEISTLIHSFLPSFSRSSLRVCGVSMLGIENTPQDSCLLLHLPCFADEEPGALEGEVTISASKWQPWHPGLSFLPTPLPARMKRRPTGS